MSNILRHTFVASDHHFGSFKLPFDFLKVFTEKQEQELIDKWNCTVGKDDIVYYNGDFCDSDQIELYKYFKKLNGQIVLIKGNHDILPDSAYKSIFCDVVDEIVLNDLDLTIHHCPGKIKTNLEIFGHIHRETCPSKLNSKDKFCSCVQSNDGYPVSLEKIMLYFKSQTCQEDC